MILVVYVLAAVAGFAVWHLTGSTGWHYLWRMFVADVAATIVTWAFGLLFRNVSVYDPYWSVAPPVMLTAWACHTGNWSSATILLLVAVWLWGIRLTANWAYTFRNLNAEDWRYTKYRNEQSAPVFHIINLFGLNLMPTIVVFLAMVPAFFAIDAAASVNVLTVYALLNCLAAVCIQFVADGQRHRFAQANPGKVCNVGLWKHARHPNYFGEILIWGSVFIFYLAAVPGPQTKIWCMLGFILIALLFRFISVPLMEKRQLQNKPEYKAYREQTRMFI